jgi:hypothetical protein
MTEPSVRPLPELSKSKGGLLHDSAEKMALSPRHPISSSGINATGTYPPITVKSVRFAIFDAKLARDGLFAGEPSER